jgi:hypothetical protein
VQKPPPQPATIEEEDGMILNSTDAAVNTTPEPPEPSKRPFSIFYKDLENDPVFADPLTWKLYTYLLWHAAFKPLSFSLSTGRGIVTISLEPWQVFCGRKKLSAALGMTEDEVRSRLDKLKKWGKITKRRTPDGTIVTLLDISPYVMPKRPTSQPIPHSVPSQSPTNPQPVPNESPHIKNEEIEDLSHIEHREQPIAAELEGDYSPECEIQMPKIMQRLDVIYAIDRHVRYCIENKFPHGKMKIEALLQQFAPLGPGRFVRAINYSMANGWKSVREDPDNTYDDEPLLDENGDEYIEEKLFGSAFPDTDEHWDFYAEVFTRIGESPSRAFKLSFPLTIRRSMTKHLEQCRKEWETKHPPEERELHAIETSVQI